MLLEQAALVLATKSVGKFLADADVMRKTVHAIVETTQDPQEISTLILVSRWESGGYRPDIADCRTRGDSGEARGIFQVHGMNDKERRELCSSDYKKQATVALSRIRGSAKSCKRRGFSGHYLLGEYVSGRCGRGSEASKLRWSDGSELTALLYTDENIVLTKHGREVMTCIQESDSMRLFATSSEASLATFVKEEERSSATQ